MIPPNLSSEDIKEFLSFFGKKIKEGILWIGNSIKKVRQQTENSPENTKVKQAASRVLSTLPDSPTPIHLIQYIDVASLSESSERTAIETFQKNIEQKTLEELQTFVDNPESLLPPGHQPSSHCRKLLSDLQELAAQRIDDLNWTFISGQKEEISGQELKTLSDIRANIHTATVDDLQKKISSLQKQQVSEKFQPLKSLLETQLHRAKIVQQWKTMSWELKVRYYKDDKAGTVVTTTYQAGVGETKDGCDTRPRKLSVRTKTGFKKFHNIHVYEPTGEQKPNSLDKWIQIGEGTDRIYLWKDDVDTMSFFQRRWLKKALQKSSALVETVPSKPTPQDIAFLSGSPIHDDPIHTIDTTGQAALATYAEQLQQRAFLIQAVGEHTLFAAKISIIPTPSGDIIPAARYAKDTDKGSGKQIALSVPIHKALAEPMAIGKGLKADERKDALDNEIKNTRTLLRLRIPNILPIGVWKTYKGTIKTLTPYQRQGSLQSFKHNAHPNETVQKQIALALVTTLQALKKNHLVHRDVKTENVLIDHNNKAHLADVEFLCTERSTNTTPGTFLPPEVKLSTFDTINSSYDAWALGFLLYELRYGYSKDLTEKMNWASDYTTILEGQSDIIRKLKSSEDPYDKAIKLLMDIDPEKRDLAKAQELLESWTPQDASSHSS